MKSLLLPLIGAALAVGAAGWAWREAPLTTHATDATALLSAAAEPDVRELVQESGVVYVRPPEIASTLRVASRMKAASVRPEEPTACEDPPCESKVYVHAVIQSIPIWNVALVTVSTRNGSREKLLLKLGGAWKIVATRGYVLGTP